VLIDKSGTAEAVVIGVGGFLGVGEKNVAVPFKSLEWMSEPRPTVSTDAPTATGTVGTATTGTAPQTNPAATEASRGYPDRAVLRMTKAELQNAPAFRYAGETRATTTAPPAATSAPTSPAAPPATAPRQ
jgi:hypothetical protein